MMSFPDVGRLRWELLMSPSYTTLVPLPTDALTAAVWTLTQQSLRKCPSDTPGGRYDGGSSSAESPSS